jgi:hypothetical protein
MRNGGIVGYGGAGPEDVIIALGGGISLHTNDVVTAVQYMDSTISPTSNSITVVSSLNEPMVEILGGESFFFAKGNEQPIDGPVFPRGRGSGPLIRVQTCCNKNVRIKIIDPKGKTIAEPETIELFPGYFETRFFWSSVADWIIPDGIPVGKYIVVASSDCTKNDANIPFYVIFNPDDVDGPPRFSFDDTAVWFGTGSNSIIGLHYYLHQSDMRVFSIAIGAIAGQTDPYTSAIAIARAEENLFAYSLSYHTQDVVEMILNYTDAQCADDACCLTALLRAVGIPSHPVTADAALETGAADWNYDTWVEFLAPHDGTTDWRIFHPHQYPGMEPESRNTFGSTRGVAKEGFNDVIVMANENWVNSQLDDGSNDVTYDRNVCQEPTQHLTKANWIGELCEQGYWTKEHWDCTAVRSRSFAIRNGFRIDTQELRFGGKVTGTLDIINNTGEREFGDLVIELVSLLPEAKKFPDRTFTRMAMQTALDGNESLTVPFDLSLPETLAPGRELFLWAHLNGHTINLRQLKIPSRLNYKINSDDSFAVGKISTITLLINNTSEEIIKAVTVDLGTPFAFQVERPTQRIEVMKPQESREISWQVRGIAPLRSGSIHISVASTNHGSLVIRRPFTIVGSEPKIDAVSGLHSNVQRRKLR